jgi:hypothetical protein
VKLSAGKARLQAELQWAVAVLVDCSFLAFWVFLQWALRKVIATLELTGLEAWVMTVFRRLFEISTLAPILIYIYVDIHVMIIRAKRIIRRELESSEADDPEAQ